MAALFLIALMPRLYSAHTVGWDWDYPGSFTLVNYDEAGSCRAALGGFEYSTFIGRQTIAITELMGHPVPPGIEGNYNAAKAYCHSPEHVSVARTYSSVTGALTVVLIAVIAMILIPARPEVAWTASALLALSGFHISESQTGTVDAPSIFFIYLFFMVLLIAVKRRSKVALAVSPAFMLAAIWTKYWVFAIFAYLATVSLRIWVYLGQGFSRSSFVVLVFSTVILFALVTNPAFPVNSWYPVLGLYYLAVPWRRVRRPLIPVILLMPAIAYLLSQVGVISSYTTGGEGNHLGSGYAAIGWNKWLRNLVNVPAVLIVGLGLPACAFLPAGIRAITREGRDGLAWLCLAPIAVFALYMMFIAPVTYYRHYLALIPAAALLSAYGLWSVSWARRPWFLPVFLPMFFIWPALLALDIGLDHIRDPRIQLREWYEEHPRDRVFFSYFVNPPEKAMSQSKLFHPEYAFDQARELKFATYLLLSENWYDTAFANELNGPVISIPERLIKTKPEYIEFYRQTLAGNHPNLKLERAIDIQNFMPELVIHKWLYGTFQMFVGDIKIYRIVE
ncbi:MAG: hypothetical protein IMF06_14390 [Proteobacteria bacterium]|nr:hypothetical protein [Pseudomonadota bacterium]